MVTRRKALQLSFERIVLYRGFLSSLVLRAVMRAHQMTLSGLHRARSGSRGLASGSASRRMEVAGGGFNNGLCGLQVCPAWVLTTFMRQADVVLGLGYNGTDNWRIRLDLHLWRWGFATAVLPYSSQDMVGTGQQIPLPPWLLILVRPCSGYTANEL